MSGTENKPKIEQMSHEEIEDAVMTALPTLDSPLLERLHELIGLEIPPENKGKKRALAKGLRVHLDGLDEEVDTEWQKFETIHNHLTTKDGKKKAGTKAADSDASSSIATTPENDASAVQKKGPANISQSEAGGNGSAGGSNLLRFKDYKFPGTIGGEPALSYTSIQYQIDCARELHYSDQQIRAGVVKATSPSHELRNYFETHKSTTLDEILELFRSHFKEGNADTMYSQFQKEFQKKGEGACKFITRLCTMRQKVVDLFEEERNPINLESLKKRFFHVIFTGLRDSNLRAELRDRCRGKTSWTDTEIIKMVAEIVAVEAERDEKLGEDGPSSTVVEVDVIEKDKKVPQKKDRPNPFALIEEMRVDHQQQIEAIRNEMRSNGNEVSVQLAQIQKTLNGTLSGSNLNGGAASFNPPSSTAANFNSPTPNPMQFPPNFASFPNVAQPTVPPNFQQSMTPQPPMTPQQFQQYQQFLQQQQQALQAYGIKKRKGNKCDDCVAKKVQKCNHCFGCGKEDHKWEACDLKG